MRLEPPLQRIIPGKKPDPFCRVWHLTIISDGFTKNVPAGDGARRL
jgi:hypothetical protein